MKFKSGCIAICLLLLVSATASAQLKLFPIKQEQHLAKNNRDFARTASNTITIPIFEEFSQSCNQPDTTLWQNSASVFISSGRGFQPPTLNVASFDGLQADGSPYSPISDSQGETDALTTCPIDISAFTATDNIYLSFFYQFGGLGESPDASDSLRVEFMDADSAWVTVWPAEGEALDRSGDFVQVILPVTADEYLHDAFRFKFQAFGRQSGPFDVWNVDYIFMNEGRNANDNSYPDRAIASQLSSVFSNNYSAVPRLHYKDSLRQGFFTITNLDIDDGSQDYTINLKATITDYLDSAKTEATFSVKDYVPQPPSSPSSIAPGEINSIFIPGIVPESATNVVVDSTFITFDIKLNSKDSADRDSVEYTNFSITNFQVNDSTKQSFTMKDFYAYDDGTAEVGAGLNFSGNRLAYEYEILGDTLRDLIAFDIYFPFVNTSPNGKSVELMVWKRLDNQQSSILYKQQININVAQGLNKFTRFMLTEPVTLEDTTIYIGFRQISNGDLAVGFDKNKDTSDKIFFNLTGDWEQDPNTTGSLMMRPVFGEVEEVISGLPVFEKDQVRVYPNPVRDMLQVDGHFKNFTLLTMSGKTVIEQASGNSQISSIDMSQLPKGLYLLKISTGLEIILKKIIKQ